jgi:hypothetical protein
MSLRWRQTPHGHGQAIAGWGLMIAFAASVAATTLQFVDFGIYGLRIQLFDMNTHASLFGGVSLFALVASASTACLLALPTWKSGAVLLLPVLLTALFVLRILHPSHVILMALPLATVTFLVLWRDAGAASSPATTLIRLGCGALVCSYLAHAFGPGVSSRLGYGDNTWPDQITLAVRHTGELAGWMIVATGLAVIYAEGRGAENANGERCLEGQN